MTKTPCVALVNIFEISFQAEYSLSITIRTNRLGSKLAIVRAGIVVFSFKTVKCAKTNTFPRIMVVRISSWYPSFNGSHFGLEPRSISTV